jgi:carbon-monoxide dehydrogenase medium subunit
MYPRPFHYHRARSLQQASATLAELGSDAKVLAGGQSLIPLMKLRFSSPAHLVDIGFIPSLSYSKRENGSWRIGPMTRHAEVESSDAATAIPIIHDCAAGIADVQVRNMGTIGGSLAEADPTGDWAPVLIALGASVVVVGRSSERTIAISDLIRDAFTNSLAGDELIKQIVVPVPPAQSGGAYLAFKRCAAVYASASVAAQITMRDKSVCQQANVVLGAVGMTPVVVTQAGSVLSGKELNETAIAQAGDAAAAAADPQDDMRGTADYKRQLVRALTREALQVAWRRARGERVEVSHHYA